ncbi:MAG: hypothetical protein JRG92_10415 [Deltaproteobacteria bacterium]|nr:hypothetical protein [Deltaproteobacteria bacterium]MBW2384040.1 hypothetical protein [Deltaproteobacteria bacterium]
MSSEPRNVMITHADEPIGRRLVKRLHFDESVRSILAVGSGPPPRAFDRFMRGPGRRLDYARVDLTRHRQVNDLFHAGPLREHGVDAVIHLPPHAQPLPGSRATLSGVPDRTTEARLILQHCLETATVRQLVALGSAYVYRLAPGNANRLTEQSELDLDPDLPPDTRSWIDCDMLLHGEIHNDRLAVSLLRVPVVVGADGTLFLNPWQSGSVRSGIRAMGFDPMCALVADRDVCSALRLAVHRRVSGIFNIAGDESLPMSVLTSWSGWRSIPLPGPLLRGAAGAARMLGADGWRTGLVGPHLRYGFTLDTSRARSELGFRPGYRIGAGRSDDGRARIETTQI